MLRSHEDFYFFVGMVYMEDVLSKYEFSTPLELRRSGTSNSLFDGDYTGQERNAFYWSRNIGSVVITIGLDICVRIYSIDNTSTRLHGFKVQCTSIVKRTSICTRIKCPVAQMLQTNHTRHQRKE
jgi:hypothetical protein